MKKINTLYWIFTILFALIMVSTALSAAVMKNTTTTAMFLPVVLGIGMRRNISPSKLLIPLAFGAILGGTCTLIGTSTNLAVSGALPRYGMEPFTMFELTKVGVPIVCVGLVYMLLLGLRLLPRREAATSTCSGLESFEERRGERQCTIY